MRFFGFSRILTAVFWFHRLLQFAELNVFLTRFSAFSYIYSCFSDFEKTRFADIPILITARGLLVLLSLLGLALCANEMQRTINEVGARYLSTRSTDIFQYPFIFGG